MVRLTSESTFWTDPVMRPIRKPHSRPTERYREGTSGKSVQEKLGEGLLSGRALFHSSCAFADHLFSGLTSSAAQLIARNFDMVYSSFFAKQAYSSEMYWSPLSEIILQGFSNRTKIAFS